ncbi:hypothetical protein ASD15_22000 [Massilia sp. Root351]|uniref:hypothetical protein n=1 Tax=Massilia sp. Root351 TaxID=1736522 RepID=UPI00070DCD5B|nr:hypothetical protein [Massilia sp. Root351]KQV78488.1 hypothetical protein ASD15_22000 [Massilia sp. Root351]
MANHQLPRKGSAAANGLVTLHGMGGVAPAVKWQRIAGWKGTGYQFHANVIDRLLLSGLVVVNDIQYIVTDAGLKFLGLKGDHEGEQPGVPAGPRYAPSPLSRAPRGRSRSPMVIREGAFDFRNHPSRIGDERLAYRGPGSFAGAALHAAAGSERS